MVIVFIREREKKKINVREVISMTTIYNDEWRKATPFSFVTVIQRLDYVCCEHVVGAF